MNIIGKGLATASIVLLAGTAYSQLKVSAEIRPRAEYRHGYKTLPTTSMDNAFFIDQRTRLNFGFKKDIFEFYVALQDVRTWGSQKQLVGNEDYGVSIHEAWGQANLKHNFSLKFGRQELSYDDQRILGNVGWAQQARSHDAFLVKYNKNKLKFDVGFAFNQDKPQLNTTSYTVGGSYKTLQYLWGNYKFNDKFNMSILAMGVGNQVNFVNTLGDNDHQDNYTLTAGTRLVYKKEKFQASLNGYYQLGSTTTWPAMDLAGYNVGVDVSYMVAKPVKLTLGFEALSGNSQTDTTAAYTGTNHAFTPFFGTNHKFNGYMDYFYVGNHVGNVGLNDAYLRVDYKHKKFTLGATGHMFLAGADVMDQEAFTATGEIKAMDPYLGTEIDVFGSFDIVKGMKCKLGYSHLIGTGTMEAIKGGDRNEVSNWAYAMIVFKPTLFTSKK